MVGKSFFLDFLVKVGAEGMRKHIKLNRYGIQLVESKHSEKDIVEPHHHQIYQILYAMEDDGEITIDDNVYPFSQDYVSFISPYSAHAIKARTKLVVLIIEFGVSALGEDIQKHLLEEFFSQSDLIKLNPIEAGEVRRLLRKMLYEQSLGEPLNYTAIKVYLAELLFILSRSQDEPAIPDANALRANRLRKYIDTNYFNVMNANELSSKLGVSSRYVNSIFKEHYNMTPLQYLNMVRLEKAKKILTETDNDIVSICFEVGFESLSTFYRTFKHATGTSPNRFREINNYSSGTIHKMDDD